VVGDNEKAIKTELLKQLPSVDIIYKRWRLGSERTLLLVHFRTWLGKIFHNVRWTGKASLGLLEGAYFAVGPASNEMVSQLPCQGYSVGWKK
jgi:hypothetical protein